MAINYLNLNSITMPPKSIDSNQIEYTEEEKKAIYIFSQLNDCMEILSTGNIQTDPLSDTQVAIIASASKELPGISISTSWDRKVLETSLSSIVGSVSSEKSGLPAEDVDAYLQKAIHLMTVLELLIWRNNTKKFYKESAR